MGKKGERGIGFFHLQLGAMVSDNRRRSFNCSLKWYCIWSFRPLTITFQWWTPKIKTTKDWKVTEGKSRKQKIGISEGQEKEDRVRKQNPVLKLVDFLLSLN